MRCGGSVCYMHPTAQLYIPFCRDADLRESRGRWRAHNVLCASNPASCRSTVFRNLLCRLGDVNKVTAEAKIALQSSFRNSFLFILKMVSSICCCWPAIVLTASNQCARKVGEGTMSEECRIQRIGLRMSIHSTERRGKTRKVLRSIARSLSRSWCCAEESFGGSFGGRPDRVHPSVHHHSRARNSPMPTAD